MASNVLNVPVSSKKMIMATLSRSWDANWMPFLRLRSKPMTEQETEASSEFLLNTQCVFSSNQTADFTSISEAIDAWTETFAAVLQTVLDWAKNGQRDFLFQFYVLLRELAAVPAYVGVLTVYVRVCMCVFTDGVEQYLLKIQHKLGGLSLILNNI